MQFDATFLSGLYVINLDLFTDERGWFARTFCKREFDQIGYHKEWVQMNHSFTKQEGTLRGLHYQHFPHSEAKLIRCISGSVYDVAVDIRKDSTTFLKWFGIELSAENKKMIYIPEGFAHGFQALSNNCEIIYHHTDFYTPDAEEGIKYDDPSIKITWPLAIKGISERDQKHLYLSENFKGI
ncbi:MAG TPA: dTDP-4-dehydrorhamnose 3,5-epimerase [Hanamia sp.]|nr:dTDP-4-dehydrorhamnose 3,5-epimerase [Hanamia sp.]